MLFSDKLLDKINGDIEIIDTDINFSEEMVVGVFLGEKQTGGYEVEVTDVLDQNDYIEFQIKINEPDPGEIVAQSITSPYHII
ncbi:MAG: protease complex subunit PrcB family protein, partial [Actinobacteria bacterium]|nr:protease complex subunit PrcB family protein [Actinomycetota bacterium]